MAVVSDTFTRANQALGGSTSDSGHTWIVQAGSGWAISGNRATDTNVSSGTQATVAIDSGQTSCSLRVDEIFAAGGSDSGVIFAGTNSANHLLLTTENPNLRLWKVSGGTYTSLWGPTPITSYLSTTKQILVEWNATTGVIKIWFGGTLQATVTLSAGDRALFATATRQGLRENGGSGGKTFFDNYSIEGPDIPTTIQAPVMTATALAVGAEVVIAVEAEVASAAATFLAPEVTVPALPVLIEAEVSTAGGNFPPPYVFIGAAQYPQAETARATGLMLVPRRVGPPPPSIYKEMVEGISPPPTVVYSFDGDSGAPVISGDDTGHSRVFDGIDDWNNVAIPEWVGHTTVVLWFQADEDELAGGLFADQGQTWRLVLTTSGLVLVLGGASSANDAALAPNGQRHMVMLSFEDRSDDFPPHVSLVKMFVDGVSIPIYPHALGDAPLQPDFSHAIIGAQWTGIFPNEGPTTFFKGRIDELAVWLTPQVDAPLQDEWAEELWLQGTGAGGPPTRVTAPSCSATTRMPIPTLSFRPVLDSWQLHDSFDGDELDPNLWVAGYQGFLLPEGPGGPAPPQPLDEAPFIVDGVMVLRAGTTITSRDWLSYGEWMFRVEMEVIPDDSEVIVAMGLFAAYAETPGYPYSAEYENQMGWFSYPLNGRRYIWRGWGVYSPNWDDLKAEEYDQDPYNPVAILTSPHLRMGQNIMKYDTGDKIRPSGSGGAVPYWPMEEGYDNPFEARLLRLVIQVTGPPESGVVITGINIVPPATRIVIPTARLIGDVEKIVDHTNSRPYEGVRGPRTIRPPVIRTTARFLRPNERASMLVEYPMRVTWAEFLFPEWAGDARPVVSFVPDAIAFASFIPPILVGEPVDVVIEAEPALGVARAHPPETSGTIKVALGITKFEFSKMPIKIGFHEMTVTIGMRELVSA